MYNKLTEVKNETSKLAPVSQLKSTIHKSALRKSAIRSSIKQDGINLQDVASLKAADDLLMKYDDNYEKYKAILDKKMKILQALES